MTGSVMPMQATIDSVGRIVIPKPLRAAPVGQGGPLTPGRPRFLAGVLAEKLGSRNTGGQ